MKGTSKICWHNIYYMICYCVDELAYFNDAYIDYEEVNSTHDLLAELLCKSFEILYKNGYIKEYNKEQIVTDKPRGRVNIPKSVSSGHIGKAELVCNVNKIGIDSELNRIIKASFSILIETNKLIDYKINKRLIAKLYRYRDILDNVSDIQVSFRELYSLTDVPEWYKPIMTVCKFIINDWLAFDTTGEHRLLELSNTRRLCYIWQKYLLKFCKREYSEYKVHNPVFNGGRHEWRTDLIIEDKNNKFALIADAKWQEKSPMSTSNINQVNAYESKYIHKYPKYSTVGLLIYASSDKTTVFEPEMMDNGKTVTEVLINIDQSKELLENDIKNVINSYLLCT